MSLYPLDTLKTRLQSAVGFRPGPSHTLCALHLMGLEPASSILPALRAPLEKKGLFEFIWYGLGSARLDQSAIFFRPPLPTPPSPIPKACYGRPRLRQAGGFRGVYRGLSSAVVGSVPSAALFWCTYGHGTPPILFQLFGQLLRSSIHNPPSTTQNDLKKGDEINVWVGNNNFVVKTKYHDTQLIETPGNNLFVSN